MLGDTDCNHTADSCKCNQSGHSPMMSNIQDRPAAAGGTGCTGHSHFCILSWSAMIWALTAAAAAACSVNFRGRSHLELKSTLYCFVLDTNIKKKLAEVCKNSLVSSKTESQRFTPQSHSTLALLQRSFL